MNRKLVLKCAGILLAASIAAGALAAADSNRGAPGFRPEESRALALLPQASGLVVIDPAGIISSAIPALLRDNPKELAELQRSVRKFQDRTGIDPLSVRSVVAAVTGRDAGDATGVLIASGEFDQELVESRISANFIIHPEVKEYRGRKIYIERIGRTGVGSKRPHFALTFLGPSTLVLGTATEVESVIDAQISGGSRSADNAELLQRLSEINPSANVRFVANIGDSLRNAIQRQAGGIAPLGQVRSVAGSLKLDISGFTAEAVAESQSAQSANTLVNFVSGAMLIARTYLTRHEMSDQSQLVLDVMNQVRISTLGSEVRVDLDLPAEMIHRITAVSARAAQSGPRK